MSGPEECHFASWQNRDVLPVLWLAVSGRGAVAGLPPGKCHLASWQNRDVLPVLWLAVSGRGAVAGVPTRTSLSSLVVRVLVLCPLLLSLLFAALASFPRTLWASVLSLWGDGGEA